MQKKRFGARLKTARARAGYPTGAAAARAIDVPTHRYANWERGSSCPDVATVVRLSLLFRVALSDLLPEAYKPSEDCHRPAA